MLQIATQMEALVTALLAIARGDVGKLTVQLCDVDFTAVVRDAWAAYEAPAASRRLAVEWDLPAAVSVRSDRALLAPLLGNLLSNAVTYTPEGGKIVCRITLHGDEAALGISNSCQGSLPRRFTATLRAVLA